jgi:hypothetical protein
VQRHHDELGTAPAPSPHRPGLSARGSRWPRVFAVRPWNCIEAVGVGEQGHPIWVLGGFDVDYRRPLGFGRRSSRSGTGASIAFTVSRHTPRALSFRTCLALSSPLAENGSPGLGVRQTFRPSIRTWGQIGSPAAFEQGDPQPPAVLLLHAWVESSACFDRPVQEVPPTLRVFAMDQRGHGDADKPATGYALVNFADDVEAFMDAVGLQSAVLLGSSSGG